MLKRYADLTNDEKVKRNYLFCIAAVLLCVRHILQLFHFSSIASFLFRLLYAVVFLLFVKTVGVKFKKKQSVFSVVVFLVGLCCLAVVFFTLLFEYTAFLEQSITFLLMFPLILCSDSIEISKSDATLFFYGISTVALSLVVSIFIPSNYENGILLLYTLNGNQSGLLYMSFFLGIYSYCFLKKNKVWLWPVLALLLYGCYLTESRTALLACLACIVLSLVLHKRTKWNKYVLNIGMLLFIFVPLFFTVLLDLFDEEAMLFGNSVATGREDIWPYVTKMIFETPFAFKIDKIISGVYVEDLGAHNVWLDIAWKFSLPVAIVFLLAMFLLCKTVSCKPRSKKSSVITACFVAGLIHMSFEAAIISGALDYSLYFLFTIFSGMSLLSKENDL